MRVCVCVYVSSVYTEEKVGQCLVACVLLLCCVFGRNCMFYSEAAAAISQKGSNW